MKSWVNKRVERFLYSRLLNALVVEDIVSNRKGTNELLIDGKSITKEEVNQMLAEIKALEGFRVWKLLSQTTKHLAEEKIFNKSIDIEDIRSGKAMLYNLSLQRSIIIAIKKKGML